MKKLSVVIPCYNEKENLKANVLKEVNDYLLKQKYPWEVIISDDGSTDDSLNIAESSIKENNLNNFRVLNNKHGGKPWAVWKGIESAKGDIVLFTDMDQSTPIQEVSKLLPWFNKGYEVVIGSRGTTRKDAPFLRKLMAYSFLTLRRSILLSDIVDTQCGFKAFDIDVAREIFPKLQFFQDINKEVKGWRVSAFDVELLFLAQKNNHKIKEVKVSWKDRDLASKGKNKNFIKESKDMAKEMFRVRLNDLKGKYDN